MQLSLIRHQEAHVIYESGYNKNAQMDLLLDLEGRKMISLAGEFLRNKKMKYNIHYVRLRSPHKF